MSDIIPVLILIDVEPDGRMIPHDQKLPWKGFEGCFRYYSELREELKQLGGKSVHFGWYYRMDPQVEEVYGDPAWGMNHYRRFLDYFIGQGDEIGVHPHAYCWKKESNSWLVDHGNQEWVNHCVKMGIESYEKTLGRKCESFRFGERWMNTETMNLLHALGIRYDLTLEPFHPRAISYIKEEEAVHTGYLPDGREFLRTPYQPSADDFSKEDTAKQRDFWAIPLSAGHYSYEFGRLEKFYKALTVPGSLKPRTFVLNPTINPKVFRLIFDECLQNVNPCYLTLPVRSDVGSNEKTILYWKENMDFIKSHSQFPRFQFVTVQEAMKLMFNEEMIPLTGGHQ